MPRKTSEVWSHFNQESKEGKEVFVCKYCSVTYKFPNATKMARHLRKCKSCPVQDQFNETESVASAAKNKLPESANWGSSVVLYTANSAEDNDQMPAVEPATTENAIVLAAGPSKKIKFEYSVEPKIDRNPVQSGIDASVARAVYSSSVPLDFLQNHYWKEAMHALNSGYKIPNISLLSNELLDQEFVNITLQKDTHLSNAGHVTLLECGWDNSDANSIVSRVAVTPLPVYMDSVELDPNTFKPEMAKQYICNRISEFGSGRLFAIVLDCSVDQDASWECITEQYPHITPIGCAAKCLNNFIEYIFKMVSITKFIDNCMTLIDHILVNPAIVKSLEKKFNMTEMRLKSHHKPVELFKALQTLNLSKATLSGVVASDSAKPEFEQCGNLMKKIQWLKLSCLMSFIMPISDSLTQLASKRSSVSEVLNTFFVLRKKMEENISQMPLLETEKAALSNHLTEREASILRPVHAASYLLDPRFKDSKALSDETEVCAVNFVSQLAELFCLDADKILANLAQYRSCEGPFAVNNIFNPVTCADPVTWWKGLFSKQPLTPIAILLLSIPSTVAMAEKCRDLNLNPEGGSNMDSRQMSKLISIRANLNLHRVSNPSQYQSVFIPEEDTD